MLSWQGYVGRHGEKGGKLGISGREEILIAVFSGLSNILIVIAFIEMCRWACQ